MERLQACMKACVTPPDDSPLALDPLLLSSTATSMPQPKTFAVASFVQDCLPHHLVVGLETMYHGQLWPFLLKKQCLIPLPYLLLAHHLQLGQH